MEMKWIGIIMGIALGMGVLIWHLYSHKPNGRLGKRLHYSVRYWINRLRSILSNHLWLSVIVWMGKSRNSSSPEKKMILVSGEPGSAGHRYRIIHMAESLRELGWQVSIYTSADFRFRLYRLAQVQWVHCWRVDFRPWHKDWDRFRALVARFGLRWSYDLDDYLFEPQIATPQYMDWLRVLGISTDHIQSYAISQQKVMAAADIFTAPTRYLADAGRNLNPAVALLPNGYDEEARTLSDSLRTRSAAGDGLLRIGYAGGSLSHQRDFQTIVPALAKVLARYHETRLVVFGKMLSISEFPALAPFRHQIEDRNWVPQTHLPQELARFDINLAPLEIQPFCHAKSELKYFEAALVGVPTVASPTAPFKEAIQDGETGLLATSPQEWEEALICLIENPQKRFEMGQKARQEVYRVFGPAARKEALTNLIQQLQLPPHPS